MRPDFKSTATGYVWLDKLTLPFWWLYEKWAERRLFREIGRGDAEKGRRLLVEALERDRAMKHEQMDAELRQMFLRQLRGEDRR